MSDTRIGSLMTVRGLAVFALFLLGLVTLGIGEYILPNGTLTSVLFNLIGAFLVVSIPAELIRTFVFDDAQRQQAVKDIEEIFDRKVASILINAKHYGLASIEPQIQMADLFNALKPGDVLWWLDTFAPGHKQWIEHVEEALDRGASVNMLIIDPAAKTAQMRALEIGGYYGPDEFIRDLQMFTDNFVSCSEKVFRGKLEIRIYENLLGVPAYIVTHEDQPIYGYSSFYLLKPTGVGFPHFRWVRAEASILEMLFLYIKKKFLAAQPIAKISNPGSTL